MSLTFNHRVGSPWLSTILGLLAYVLIDAFTSTAFAAETATVRRDALVHERALLDAKVVGKLKAGERVTIESLNGSWVQVRSPKVSGWMRALFLQSASQPELSKVSQLASGRAADNSLISTTGIRSLTKASRHALIITIGDYADPTITDLKGVRFDSKSAQTMAEAMSIPLQNMTFLQDSDATESGFLSAVNDLVKRVRPGDRVFVYYSGHGTRMIDHEFDPNSCTEGLITHDGKILSNRAISQAFQPIGSTADKLMVFYDACHSGGVVGEPMKTRSVRLGQTTLTPKFTGAISPDKCSKPSNMRTRSLSGELGRAGLQKENVVFVAASRPSELSFDDPNSGGLATQSFRDCLLGEAKDLDQSGAVSVAEITVCAQTKLDARLAGQPEILGQKMTVGGNPSFVPNFNDITLAPTVVGASEQVDLTKPTEPQADQETPVAVSPEPSLPVNVVITTSPEPTPPESGSTSQSPSTPISAVTPPTPPSITPTQVAEPEAFAPVLPIVQATPILPSALLNEIFQQRDAQRELKLVANPSKMRIKKDRLGLEITPSHDGYLYLALAGSDNKSLYLLFPNELDGNNLVKAGKPIKLPSRGWRIRASGPEGVNTVLAIVSDSPRALSSVKGEISGPFVKTLLSQDGNSRLHAMLGTSGNADQKACQEGGKTRNLTVEKECSDSFSAALVTIEEVQAD